MTLRFHFQLKKGYQKAGTLLHKGARFTVLPTQRAFSFIMT